MQVYLLRAVDASTNQTRTPQDWAPRPFVVTRVDLVHAEFESKYPGMLPSTVNPLDFTLIIKHRANETTRWIFGKFWGDETKLEPCQYLVDLRNNNHGYQMQNVKCRVLVCHDNQHPTDLSFSEICGPSTENFVDPTEFVVQGYYRANDPYKFVTV